MRVPVAWFGGRGMGQGRLYCRLRSLSMSYPIKLILTLFPKPDDSAAKVQDTSFSSKSAITVRSI